MMIVQVMAVFGLFLDGNIYDFLATIEYGLVFFLGETIVFFSFGIIGAFFYFLGGRKK